jgi:hypothetical protein
MKIEASCVVADVDGDGGKSRPSLAYLCAVSHMCSRRLYRGYISIYRMVLTSWSRDMHRGLWREAFLRLSRSDRGSVR